MLAQAVTRFHSTGKAPSAPTPTRVSLGREGVAEDVLLVLLVLLVPNLGDLQLLSPRHAFRLGSGGVADVLLLLLVLDPLGNLQLLPLLLQLVIGLRFGIVGTLNRFRYSHTPSSDSQHLEGRVGRHVGPRTLSQTT